MCVEAKTADSAGGKAGACAARATGPMTLALLHLRIAFVSALELGKVLRSQAALSMGHVYPGNRKTS